MRKIILTILFVFLFALGGCGEESEQDNTQVEQLDGYEELSDEETNQKLINEADEKEVVPDK